MDLKTFVAESISQICSGIIEAQEKTKGIGAVVSPICNHQSDGSTIVTHSNGHIVTTTMIHYDVALSAADSMESDKKGEKHGILQIANIKIEAGFSSGTDSNLKYETESISHIKFDIPVIWPMASADHLINIEQAKQYPTRVRQRSSLYED